MKTRLTTFALTNKRSHRHAGANHGLRRKVTSVYFKGIGYVRVHQHRAVKGRIKTITNRRENGPGT